MSDDALTLLVTAIIWLPVFLGMLWEIASEWYRYRRVIKASPARDCLREIQRLVTWHATWEIQHPDLIDWYSFASEPKEAGVLMGVTTVDSLRLGEECSCHHCAKARR